MLIFLNSKFKASFHVVLPCLYDNKHYLVLPYWHTMFKRSLNWENNFRVILLYFPLYCNTKITKKLSFKIKTSFDNQLWLNISDTDSFEILVANL